MLQSFELQHEDTEAYLLASTQNQVNLKEYTSAGVLNSVATLWFQFPLY